MKNELNSVEVKKLLRYFINNNIKLSKSGKKPIAIEIEGLPGTAKTSVVKQIGEEFDYHYVRLNVSEIEVCDLIGLPIYEYKICKGEECIWVTDKVLGHYISMGYTALNESRTGYAPPSWIQGREDKPILLVLDDFNRCTPMMANATMTLIDEQKYISWGLPEGSTIVLTCNPSDQDFMVQTEDSAQKTRRLQISMKADVDVWASEFAEAYGVDSRCINFMLKHPEIIEGAIDADKDGNILSKGNLRIWTKYFDSISGIDNFDKDLDLIRNLGMGSLPSEHINLFITFIKNGLDRLPTPKQLLHLDPEVAKKELKKVIKEGTDRRSDIAAIIAKRMLNYAMVNEKEYTKEMVENYALILESGLLTTDICVLTIKKLCILPKFKSYPMRPDFMKLLTAGIDL